MFSYLNGKLKAVKNNNVTAVFFFSLCENSYKNKPTSNFYILLFITINSDFKMNGI